MQRTTVISFARSEEIKREALEKRIASLTQDLKKANEANRELLAQQLAGALGPKEVELKKTIDRLEQENIVLRFKVEAQDKVWEELQKKYSDLQKEKETLTKVIRAQMLAGSRREEALKKELEKMRTNNQPRTARSTNQVPMQPSFYPGTSAQTLSTRTVLTSLSAAVPAINPPALGTALPISKGTPVEADLGFQPIELILTLANPLPSASTETMERRPTDLEADQPASKRQKRG